VRQRAQAGKEGVNVRGPCSSCGAQLATDQRYCVECGQRVGPPLALPYSVPVPPAEAAAAAGRNLFGIALPVPMQMVTTFAAIALGFGVVVGTAISPNLAGIVASPAPTVVAQAPPPASTPAPAKVAGGGGGGGAPVASTPVSSAPSSSSTGSSGGGGGGGGGGKKKKQKKPQTQPLNFSGTVVRVNAPAQSYTLSTGGLISIHADALPNVGDALSVPVRRLANGTYAEQGARSQTGTADSASFSGTVTYCADLEQPAAPCNGSSATDHYVYTVSGIGSSVLVSAPSPAQGAPPPVGSSVDVSVHIGGPFQPISPATWAADPSCTPPYDEHSGTPAGPPTTPSLTQTSANVTAQNTNANLEAVVQTICPGGAPKLVLSADDIRESGRDLAELDVPAGIDLTKLTPGEPVEAAVDVAQDGRLSLTGVTSDQGTAGADDAGQGQGSLSGK
jgi:hypothetical protein